MRGWVYIISNISMPDLVKVGYTMKDPNIRASELNHTGSPTPFVVEYEILVENPYEVEQEVHAQLREYNAGKEWFRCSIAKVDSIIQKIPNLKIIIKTNKSIDYSKMITEQGHFESKVKRNKEPFVSHIRDTSTFNGACQKCGIFFKVTLTEFDTYAQCPNCFHDNIRWKGE